MVAVNYLWNPINDNIVREFDDAGSVVAEYTTEPDLYGSVVSQYRDGQTSYLHSDALGSTTELTNDAGNVTDTIRYSAFGEVTQRTGTTEIPFQYVGGKGYYRDIGTETYLVRVRRLPEAVGRWSSSDPYVAVLDTALTPYRYAFNNPCMFVDPSGMICMLDKGGDLKRHCCPLATQATRKCLKKPPLITRTKGCKYKDDVCFAICDSNGVLQSWPISCVCKHSKWGDNDKIVQCLRGCLQCLFDETKVTPDIPLHDECMDSCINLHYDVWEWKQGIAKAIVSFILWDIISQCIRLHSANKASFKSLTLPPIAVPCIDGVLEEPEECGVKRKEAEEKAKVNNQGNGCSCSYNVY